MEQRLWNRNYSMVVAGQVVSLFANNILYFALSLYILDLTGSGAYFGGITALSMIPTILFTPFGGVLADRVNKRNVMVGMDFLTAVVVLALGSLLFGRFALGAVAVLLMALSIIEAFYTPCVSSCIPQLQQPDNLVRANAIVSQVAMSANILGPILGGVLYGFVGLRPILIVSIVCFVGAAAMELFIRIPHVRMPKASGLWKTVWGDLVVGVRFMAKEQPEVLRMMPAIAGINFSAAAVVTVGAPYIVRLLLGYSSQLYGVANGCIAAAGLAGGLLTALMASRMRTGRIYRPLLWSGISLLPLAAAFALRLPAMAVYLVMVASFMGLQLFASYFSIFAMSAVQSVTPRHLLGKTMAFITALSVCAEPVGRVLYGGLFDLLRGHAWWIVAGTAALTVALGMSTRGAFQTMEQRQQAAREAEGPAKH